jgi:hypothetical protein
MEPASGAADARGNAQNMCWSLLDEAETRVGRDEIDAAASALDAALAIPTAANDGSSTIEKHFATAIARAAQGATTRPSRRPTRSSTSSLADRRRRFTTSTSARRGARLGFDALEDGCCTSRRDAAQGRAAAARRRISPVRQRPLAPLAAAGPAGLGARPR